MNRKLGFLIILWSISLPSLAYGSKPDPGEEFIAAFLVDDVVKPSYAPANGGESEGPFSRLVITNANVVNGTGAPLQGPITIVIEDDRIIALHGAGTASAHSAMEDYGDNVKIIDASGKYVLPGFIDAHAHLGSPTHLAAGSLTDPEYVMKLWLAHGITTVRDVGAIMGLQWTLEHKRLSEANKITAPRMMVYAMFPEAMATPKKARDWVRSVRKKGADGVKFLGASPESVEAAIDEAQKLGMKTAYHHSQVSVARVNVLDSARLGLNSMEHWYGLPEAMFTDRQIQHYPDSYNYNNEQDRFSEAGKLWRQTAGPNSIIWKDTIEELIELDFTIDPTFTIYEANRDLSRARNAEWHEDYTMPYMRRAFQPNPKVHGSYHFDWTTSHEISWKRNYQRWMAFINDFKNAGGRVTVGSDAGFIHKVYGFAYIRELELLQEAGFHPLEVIQSATLKGAELLGIDRDVGSIELGKKADLVIVNENPLANFKVLYGTGHERFNPSTDKIERTKGILYTIKDGVVFDADHLLSDVRKLVAKQKGIEKAALDAVTK